MDILSNEDIMREYVLSKIVRYNHRNKIQSESVAEHTCFVSIFCLKIMAQVKELTDEERYAIMVKAALHDTCESVTSDIPHDVKNRFPKMREMLEEIEEEYYETYWKLYNKYIDNDNKIVYNIIKLADTYSVKQYVLNERDLGNTSESLRRISEDAEKRIQLYTSQLNYEIEKRRESYAREQRTETN